MTRWDCVSSTTNSGFRSSGQIFKVRYLYRQLKKWFQRKHAQRRHVRRKIFFSLLLFVFVFPTQMTLSNFLSISPSCQDMFMLWNFAKMLWRAIGVLKDGQLLLEKKPHFGCIFMPHLETAPPKCRSHIALSALELLAVLQHAWVCASEWPNGQGKKTWRVIQVTCWQRWSFPSYVVPAD